MLCVLRSSEDEVEESEIASADAEDTLTADDMKAARTRAAVTEAQNAGLDDLAAATRHAWASPSIAKKRPLARSLPMRLLLRKLLLR